jgi:signal transduction histidine kinase
VLRRARFLAAWGIVLALSAAAERLPLKVFDSSQGLAGDAVRALFRDSRGFLWIGTSSGLSRFDGQTFPQLRHRRRSPSPRVTDVAESPDGTIWVTTELGLARLDAHADRGSGPFVAEPLPLQRAAANCVIVDRAGIVWVGGVRPVRLDPRATGAARSRVVELPAGNTDTLDFALGADGRLWIATGQGLVLRRSDGSVRLFELGGPNAGASAVAVDGAGHLWVGGPGGVYVLAETTLTDEGPRGTPLTEQRTLHARSRRPAEPGELPGRPGEILFYTAAEGLAGDFIYSIEASGEGERAVWIGSRAGVTGFADGGLRTITPGQGLPEAAQVVALEDRDGSVWFGSESCGLTRLLPAGFVSYGIADGLADERAASLLDGPDGALDVVTASRNLHRFDGTRFDLLTPRMLFPRHLAGWGWNQFVATDRNGAIWYPVHGALYRYPPLADARALRDASPERRWTEADGLPGVDIFRVYEDRRGDVWVSSIADPPLVRLVGGERIAAVPEVKAGVETGGAPTAFAEDRAGNLWVGFYVGGVARVRDGRWTFFGAADGVPQGFVSDLFVDREGRLWIATTSGGVGRVDQPAAEQPVFRRYTSAEGLTTSSTRCLTEDREGRIFVGTSRGIDRLDPASGSVRGFSTEEGLPNNLVFACHAAPDGTLWFGTLHGLARYDPGTRRATTAPRVRITGVAVSGQARSVPELGVNDVPELELAAASNSLAIEYVGISPASGSDLTYQYRLGDDQEWSARSSARSADFPRLGAGRYRFEVRAVTRDGVASVPTAGVSFRILPPFWQRPWFVALVALMLAGLGWIAMRIRVARLIAVERARTRIASDLHDDVGSSISRIGILGELARQRVQASPVEAEEMLGEIGREARELVEATSDIVWAVDPHRDDLGSLVVRLRRFAVDLLEARGVALEFEAPAEAAAVVLPPEVRRAFYLCLKESIHNVAKHSNSGRARVRIELRPGHVHGEVLDDGTGIASDRAAAAEAAGRRGLPGLHRRAQAAGGEVKIDSAPGRGTRVEVTLPLRQQILGRRRSHDRATSAGDVS